MIYFNEKIFLLALETTYGTAPALAAANAILATDIRIMPMEGQDLARNLERPHMGAQATIPVDLHTKMSFKVELVPSGTAGTAPVIAPLLRALGCAQTIVASTSVTYNPVSRNHESCSVHLWVGDTRFALTGARGTGTIRVPASGIPVLEVELTGLWTEPAEVARVVPTLTTQLNATILAATTVNTPVFTINSIALPLRNLSMAMRNRVEPRFLIGSDRVMITAREETLEATVEARPLTTFNPFALARASTRVPITLQHGVTAGNRVTLAAPTSQVLRLAALEEQQGITEWPLRFTPLPTNTGNDQWSLTFS